MDQRQKLGARIRELRLKLGLTQQTLGERCDLSYKYLGNVERARENPTFDALLKIASGLGIEPWELLVFEHTEKDPAALRKELNGLIKDADLSILQAAMKILRALSH